jgi:hypothetical protein
MDPDTVSSRSILENVQPVKNPDLEIEEEAYEGGEDDDLQTQVSPAHNNRYTTE